MGCSQSGASGVQTPTQRRRLSVGAVDEQQGDPGFDTTEEDRGLIAALSAATVIDMIEDGGSGTGGRRFSIGSQTDQVKTSFVNKSIAHIGDEISPVSLGMGYTCRKGLKPESPNQDSWTVLKVDGNFSIYGVFDGHGKQGHDVSNFVKDNLPKLIIKDKRFKSSDMPASLSECFRTVQSLVATADRMKKLSAQMSGTTATVVVHDHSSNKLTVAHVADSTCVLGSWSDSASKGAQSGVALTRDHKPNLKDERARIEKAGGRVVFDGYANHRVYAKNGRYPGLNMSRCLGDLMGHADAGCSCDPEVLEHPISPKDSVLLLCSDGVWEFITPQEAIDMVGNQTPKQAMNTADTLAKEAWDRWIREEGGAVVDDITVVLVYLQQ
mmetsp:Transcript_116445/g.336370  ORF Transcript_116445/g.336370 Transcript_116445/m.336370 type:complete len:382 (-) Transcript_116445:180-1325(-)